ncbi:MAG: ABC-F family ATP-binding cassette domain-containing protein [Myxococcales bacterium]|nr:ABC-F family ATP-binding cassette domain-containing protein [Myxococcales bacterium]
MPSLSVRAQRVSFSYSDRQLFDEVSFHLGPGWTGVVGANGSGKSTLLQLISGELRPDAGQLRVEPRGARVVRVPQQIESPGDEVGALAGADEGWAHQLRGVLGLDPGALARWPTLSPGERKRWQVGAALWREPQVLLLDEPTNHLDASATAILVRALQRFDGVGLLVSHDRHLLAALTTSTLRLHRGSARLFPLPFDEARRAWLEEERLETERQEEAARRLNVAAARLDEARRRHEAASRQRSTGARMKGMKDSDARTLGADYRAELAEKGHAAALRRNARKAGDAREEAQRLRVKKEPGRSLFLRDAPCPRPVVLSFTGAVRHAGGAQCLRDVAVQLGRGEHVAVTGDNGAGKSTLLATLRDAAGLPEDKVLWLPQELSTSEAAEDLARLRALPPEERGRVLQLLDALGVDPEDLLRTTAPSPGEARKLHLALGLGRGAWLAVLDEPENHLDLPSLERLEAALQDFPGALLVVTHDERLARAVTARRWHLAGGLLHHA